MTLNSNALNQYNSAYNNLSGFMNSGNYQLSYGNDQALNPAQNFLQNSGVQLANQLALNQVNNQYASQGLGASGALATGLQNQEFSNYNTYNNQQQALLQNYQGQLSALNTQGQAVNGSALAGSNASSLAGIQAQGNLSTGQSLASLYANTGDNISSLYANQGVLDSSAILNTGAAQANNLFQTAQLGAQLNASANATNAGTQNSLLQGQGAVNQANSYNAYSNANLQKTIDQGLSGSLF